MEKTLLGADRLKRMIDGNLDDALKILSEVGFGFGGQSSDNIDDCADAETLKLSEFIKETSPDKKLTDFFLFPYDFRNAEALIKSKFLKTDPIVFAGGRLDVKDLKEKIFADDYGHLPKFRAIALSESDKSFVEGTASGVYINELFTKALYEELYALNIKNRYVSESLCAETDFINVSIALRIRDFDRARKQFLHYGKLGEKELKILCVSAYDDIRERFRFNDYKDEIYTAILGLESGMGLVAFERLCKGYAVKLIKKHKYDFDGVLPFIRYCFYKLADIANVRTIVVGLSSGITGEEISERIREFYEG